MSAGEGDVCRQGADRPETREATTYEEPHSQKGGHSLPQETRPDDLEQEDADIWLRRVRSAKRAARSELSVSGGDWTRRGHAASDVLSTEKLTDTLERVHWRDLSVREFEERYERPKRPVIVTGLCDEWQAGREWTEDNLLRRYGEHRFKVGSDDDGYAVRLKFKHFLQYMHDSEQSRDDSPLYIFDGSFAEKRGSRRMRRDYSLPFFFREDLMRFGGEHRRPPYRWFVMGPARSGSYIHVDPLATSAWNALLDGYKRWALFPPGTQKPVLQPKEPGLEREAVSWFRHVFPRTQKPDWPEAKPITVIQGPGETMFVPGGWWHTVMNLTTPTIAVTHNYASTPIFREVWAHTRRGRPKFSAKWLSVLRAERPDLAEIADEVARRDEGPPASSTSSSSSSSSSSSDSSSSSSSSSDEEVEQRPAKRSRATEQGPESRDSLGNAQGGEELEYGPRDKSGDEELGRIRKQCDVGSRASSSSWVAEAPRSPQGACNHDE